MKRATKPLPSNLLPEENCMAKSKTLADLMLQVPDDFDVPYAVWTVFGQNARKIAFAGRQASLAEDFKELPQLRAAIEWYVTQLNGKVEWK